MPKPRRRRRFFALEGRLEVDDTGEVGGSVDPERPDTRGATASAQAAPGGASAELDRAKAGDREEAGAPEQEDETLPPAFRLNRAPRPRPPQRRLFNFRLALLALGCSALGLLGGYLLARSAQGPARVEATGSAQKDATSLTGADQDDLDAAYAARHAHRYEEAERIFNVLKHRHPGWGPIEIELGRTLFYAGKSYDAGFTLKAAADAGVRPAEANFLLAMLNKGRKSWPGAETSFEKAVAIDPTQPEYYFFWGECLREEGKVREATTKFRSALLRNQYETATGLYLTKLWLCAIEADEETTDGINEQIDSALAQPYPPMEAFVATAARDLKAGNLAAAAGHLARARRRADAIVFRYVLGDPVFAPARTRPEFAEFFESTPPAPSRGADAKDSPASSNTGKDAPPASPVRPPDSPAKAKNP